MYSVFEYHERVVCQGYEQQNQGDIQIQNEGWHAVQRFYSLRLQERARRQTDPYRGRACRRGCQENLSFGLPGQQYHSHCGHSDSGASVDTGSVCRPAQSEELQTQKCERPLPLERNHRWLYP